MDADGCLWICIDPGCPELCAEECLAGIDPDLQGLLATEEF